MFQVIIVVKVVKVVRVVHVFEVASLDGMHLENIWLDC